MPPDLGPDCLELIKKLDAAAPNLRADINELSTRWLKPLAEKLAHDPIPREPKIFNDPVWGSIILHPAEVLLLDTPLLQRLRGVRQLGMAHLVYPGSGYDRLEHMCGVVEAAARMLSALQLSAISAQASQGLVAPSINDVATVRLAALLHDIGHGPYSHATEYLLMREFKTELDAAIGAFIGYFDGILRIEPAEALSALIILSEAFLSVLLHSRFPADEREFLPLKLVGSILGSAKHLSVSYLATVLSGAIDADKLDYMSRDSHHAGLTLGLETTRLLSQMHVVWVTKDNAPDEDLRQKALGSPSERYLDVAISRAGLGAYEQMVVGRAILYDRIYYHHKVRAAESMVRRLILMAERDSGRRLTLKQLLPSFTDETFLCVLGGIVTSPDFEPVQSSTQELARAIANRNLFCRSYAFAVRCLADLDRLTEVQKNDTSALVGNRLLNIAAEPKLATSLEERIAVRAGEIARKIGGKYIASQDITVDDVVVDLPEPDRVSTRGAHILIRAGASDLELPNLYFDPDKWTKAYQTQKHCGYVYCDRRHIPAVNLAAKVVFAEQLGIVMGVSADRLCKTTQVHDQDIFEQLLRERLISADAFARLGLKQTRLWFFDSQELDLPDRWREGEDRAKLIADSLNKARTKGYSAPQHTAIKELLASLSRFSDMALQGGSLKSVKIGQEVRLQEKLRDHMRSRQEHVTEGERLTGGPTDLVFKDLLVIENKIYGETDRPLDIAHKYAWQARQYAIGLSEEIVVVVVGYKPKTAAGMRMSWENLGIRRVNENTVEIRLAVPIDFDDPSSVQVPQSPPS